jgi:hypothetical protein
VTLLSTETQPGFSCQMPGSTKEASVREKTALGTARRGETFQQLATALGITSSALRRWARRDRIHGAAFVRGRWILRGPLTLHRIETIRSGLNLCPEIAEGRRGKRQLPVKRKRNRNKTANARKHSRKVADTRRRKRELNGGLTPSGYLEAKELARLERRLERLTGEPPEHPFLQHHLKK